MARNTDPVCKMCRREQMKLFLKGERCFSPKCPIDREKPPPGMHGLRRGKQSEYGLRLREKQKLKRFYGILEAQFRRYYDLATRSPENTGEQLLSILERRLDNVVHRLGLAISRTAARQMVAHGHVQVNGRKCDIPSMLLKPGDVVKVKPREGSLKMARETLQKNIVRIPDFLELTNNQEQPEGRMTRLPNSADVDERFYDRPESLAQRVQLIIEIATR
ncbi:30s ribosomal protein s4 : 30S ribosomal protein S4 OS=Singulisphaera acidiphila (strain ATCC BAA-1392 / DSM 18658 / VKM B-2454 / MOB10) GN=rpsD PE=3 SV=1: Ribosomal_S4: S4 [Gemmataceae bacterium]|jgi:small subunit ribosomal protein S4|nr:30s ribosomal protein s4 : 30S ribosomal protein S4 OS=Singulisphaera acidiphila (strain ATCC BAA-1392 / DSM 18658 / VKM B-2454 / MOB10) GN=rpsD PE=3 SV=1: Ribosomal_S4: S4 [Gemmataceae bacterium]VTU01575.1 30s ribosomal protein s4 : 30S ribosomal protein S4 OS=Singulisphaera acidiphila (strain ATCC BAA-1392 / DSM 18658 / VKM B-2454 / MOB10) GN=rpsD PE=3 SV=1: Ribosomal_S4: S4 [Gemmataceae bacterium]